MTVSEGNMTHLEYIHEEASCLLKCFHGLAAPVWQNDGTFFMNVGSRTLDYFHNLYVIKGATR